MARDSIASNTESAFQESILHFPERDAALLLGTGDAAQHKLDKLEKGNTSLCSTGKTRPRTLDSSEIKFIQFRPDVPWSERARARQILQGCAENLSWVQQLEFLDAYINFQEHPEFLPVREYIASAIKASSKSMLQRPALSVMPSVRPSSSPKGSLFPSTSVTPQPQLASPLVLISPPFQPTTASQPVVSGTLSPMQFSLAEDSAGPAASPCTMPPPFKRSRMNLNLTPLFGPSMTPIFLPTDLQGTNGSFSGLEPYAQPHLLDDMMAHPHEEHPK